MIPNIFERLAEMNKNKLIKQKDIAEELGITQAHASELLNGKRKASKSLTILAEILYGERTPEHPNPKIRAVIEMMESMDTDTQESALNCVQKEKLFEEVTKERQEKKAA